MKKGNVVSAVSLAGVLFALAEKQRKVGEEGAMGRRAGGEEAGRGVRVSEEGRGKVAGRCWPASLQPSR